MSVLTMKMCGVALADARGRLSRAESPAAKRKATRDRDAAVRLLIEKRARTGEELAAKVAALRLDMDGDLSGLTLGGEGQLLWHGKSTNFADDVIAALNSILQDALRLGR